MKSVNKIVSLLCHPNFQSADHIILTQADLCYLRPLSLPSRPHSLIILALPSGSVSRRAISQSSSSHTDVAARYVPGRSAPQDLTCQYTMARYKAATVYHPPSSAAPTTRSAASRPTSATGARQQASENKRRTAALWSLFDSFVSNRDESIESGVIRQLGKAHESLGAEAGWDSRRNSSLMCELRATEQVEVDDCVSGTDRQANRQTDRQANRHTDRQTDWLAG